MDGEMILESLDSLWFFSNILSPPPSPPPPSINNNTNDPPKPKEPLPITRLPDLAVKRVSESKEREDQERVPGWSEEVKLELRKVTGDCGKLAKSSNKYCKKDVNEVKELVNMMGLGFHQLGMNHGQQRVRISRPLNVCNMPPLSDGLAMKEHLKSWAYAVACAVR